MNLSHLPNLSLSETLRQAKWAFTTRRVPRPLAAGLDRDFSHARAGDLVLAEVIELGHHTGLQLASRRRADLYPGDRIVLCLGNRYAPDQFEAVAELRDDELDLVAAGGLAGRVLVAHARMDPPTRLRPLGLLCDAAGARLNLDRFALNPEPGQGRPPVIAVLGTSMNSGKTTTAAALIHGLARAGLKVGAAKVTGTGAFADPHMFEDAGAFEVIDFCDFGYASTYRMPLPSVERVLEASIEHLSAMDAIVIEVADGLFQRETGPLLRSPVFAQLVDACLFAAPDALSAVHGEHLLRGIGLNVLAVSGLLTMSPLACAEAAEAIDAEVLTREALWNPQIARGLLALSASAPVRQRVPMECAA